MTTTAQIIDQHRQNGRSVGHGVTVHCACGAELWALVSGDQPIDGEHNSHRDADRKHAEHVANHLARQEITDAEQGALIATISDRTGLLISTEDARAALTAAKEARA